MTRILNGLAPSDSMHDCEQGLSLKKLSIASRIQDIAPRVSFCEFNELETKNPIERRHDMHLLSSRRTSHIQSNEMFWDSANRDLGKPD